jgi:hypothetical protein
VLNKPQAIDAIIRINRTATREFLERFEVPALYRYLNHLQLTQEPRGPHSRWQREPHSPAIVTREPAD